jgi:hypothetical protein
VRRLGAVLGWALVAVVAVLCAWLSENALLLDPPALLRAPMEVTP